MAEDGELIPRQGRDDFLADLLLSVGIGDDIRYDHLQQHWLIWKAPRWRIDQTRAVQDLVRTYASKYWASTGESDGDLRKMLSTLFDTAKKKSVLESLSARAGIAMTGSEWDTDPYLMGFENGILDLRTREFDYHPPQSIYVSKSVGYDWDPDAEAPYFEAFVQSIMGADQEMIMYLMTVLGYSLFGLQSEQKFWVWVGRGSNGKGILARTMLKTLGSYAMAPADTLYMRTRLGAAPSSAARPDLVKLQAVRFTAMSEPQGGQFNDEMIKAHTGDDLILARNLYARAEQMTEFPPTHTINFLVNDPPKTDDTGVSMRRRVRVINFDQDFSGSRADMTLEGKIATERQGIIALLTKFAKGWWRDGDPHLQEPALVTEWSEAYIKENDPLSRFIEEACVTGIKERGPAGSLWGAYEEWCARANQEPMSQTGFGNAMTRKYTKKHGRTGSVYTGIRAKNAGEVADG